jgi:CRISPR/Cas system-associated exonuclease Cas4 (RecB family)
MEQMCRDSDGGSALASRGTKIHAAIAAYISKADYQGEPLDEQESAILASLVDFWDTYAQGLAHEDGLAVEVERRLEVRDFRGVVLYGYADVLVRYADRAVVIDWKTGYKAVDDAGDNLQGAAYALAAFQEFRCDVVEVLFYNPCIHQRSQHTFSGESLARVYGTIATIEAKCEEPDAPCIPGQPQCQYCKAAGAGICPAYMGLHTATAELAATDARVPYTKMPDEVLGQIYERCKMVDRVEASVEAELKRRIEANGTCAGWTMIISSGGREAPVGKLYLQVQDVLDMVAYLSCCKVSVSQVETAYAKAVKALGKVKTEKEGKALFAGITLDVVTEKAPRKSIVKEV